MIFTKLGKESKYRFLSDPNDSNLEHFFYIQELLDYYLLVLAVATHAMQARYLFNKNIVFKAIFYFFVADK